MVPDRDFYFPLHIPVKNDIQLTIDKLIVGGIGLGRLADGMVVMVPFVLPGETVRVSPVKRKKRFVQAELVDIVTPSPDRTDPPCPLFGRCGGCDLQHASPASQAAHKNEILLDQLNRVSASVDWPSMLTDPLPSPKAFHYRQRITLQVGGHGEVGFHRHRSHIVEPVSHCLLARDEINDVLAFLQDHGAMADLFPFLSTIELQFSPVDGRVVMIARLKGKLPGAGRTLLLKMGEGCTLLKSILLAVPGNVQLKALSGSERNRETFLLHFTHMLPEGNSLAMSLEAGGFCQVNMEQNDNLIGLLLEWADLAGEERVLDLFCGMGNFSLPLAGKAGEVVGMDIEGSTIKSANRNREMNQITNCRFRQKSALDGVRLLVENGEKFDLLLLDPPRQGCREIIPFVGKLGIGRVLYVSCDPATLCRDLGLLAGQGYMVKKIKVVDMFPQTHHLETVVSLERQ